MMRKLVLLTALIVGACQSAGADVPAVLESADQETMAQINSVLTEATGRANIELGPSDPAQGSAISVLPPRPTASEDRSVARPIVFDIVLRGSSCYLVRRDTGEAFALSGIACIPAE